ncbi:unnamed protein product [Meloidogyne enterolobii]|uniref:Uncharacterized protein n=1 Tax=Meloidogyne enterolobii TaxID=390850 RepID=A0ACB0ZP77_MELEN
MLIKNSMPFNFTSEVPPRQFMVHFRSIWALSKFNLLISLYPFSVHFVEKIISFSQLISAKATP